jgi:hypothetical protein
MTDLTDAEPAPSPCGVALPDAAPTEDTDNAARERIAKELK